MDRKMLTFAKGTSDCIDTFMGKPTQITIIVTDISEKKTEVKIHTPMGWNTESLITTMMCVVTVVQGIKPKAIHFAKMELLLSHLN